MAFLSRRAGSSARAKTLRVLVHGLPYFGEMFAELMRGDGWEFCYFPDEGVENLAGMARELCRCDLAYQIGGRVTLGKFLRAAKWLHKKKIVMHWVGSDTLDEQRDVAEGNSADWVTNRIHHWAESHWMVREVEALGLECDLVPLPSSCVTDRPSPLPSEFSVLVYVPDVRRGALYGLDRILQAAKELPHIPFELVGLTHGDIPAAPENLRIHGRLADLSGFYRRATVLWRPVRHDGLSFMVLEALGHGRHVLWSYEFPGSIVAETPKAAVEEISRLYTLHQQGRLDINFAGVEAIAANYLPQLLRSMIHRRLEAILQS